MRKTATILAALGIVTAIAAAAPAQANEYWRGDDGWRQHAWQEHEGREHHQWRGNAFEHRLLPRLLARVFR
jgi:Spy/CpxP family protein refolding chaperone